MTSVKVLGRFARVLVFEARSVLRRPSFGIGCPMNSFRVSRSSRPVAQMHYYVIYMPHTSTYNANVCYPALSFAV